MRMNKLPLAKRTQILAMLCEGSSMRSISRVADVSINTVLKLLVEASEACLALHDETVLMDDLRARLANRVQLTTDGHRAYLEAVEEAFGADVDYAQLVKLYGPTVAAPGRYSPAECIGAKKVRREGNPDEAHVSTS